MTPQCEICGRELGGGHRKPGLSYECLRLGFARLKAENASLLESLRESREELARLQRTVAHQEAAYLKEHGHWGECSHRVSARDAEQRNTELEAILVRIRADGYVAGGMKERITAALHDEERSAPLSADDCPECPEEGCVLDADHEEPCDTDIPETAADEERSAPPRTSETKEFMGGDWWEPANPQPWRQGSKVPQNVYAADGAPIAQFHDASVAALVVEAVNRLTSKAEPPAGPPDSLSNSAAQGEEK